MLGRTSSKQRGVRAENKERDLAIVRRLATLPPQERLVAWKRETGKGKATFYERLGELSPDESGKSRVPA
jgi:hypothetical protein